MLFLFFSNAFFKFLAEIWPERIPNPESLKIRRNLRPKVYQRWLEWVEGAGPSPRGACLVSRCGRGARGCCSAAKTLPPIRHASRIRSLSPFLLAPPNHVDLPEVLRLTKGQPERPRKERWMPADRAKRMIHRFPCLFVSTRSVAPNVALYLCLINDVAVGRVAVVGWNPAKVVRVID